MQWVTGLFLEDKVIWSFSDGTIAAFTPPKGKAFSYIKFPTCFIVKVDEDGVMAVFVPFNVLVRFGQGVLRKEEGLAKGCIVSVDGPRGVLANTAAFYGGWTDQGTVAVSTNPFVSVKLWPNHF